VVTLPLNVEFVSSYIHNEILNCRAYSAKGEDTYELGNVIRRTKVTAYVNEFISQQLKAKELKTSKAGL
jgi:hypothetical protein